MNNLEKGRKIIAGGIVTAIILSSNLSGCDYQIPTNEKIIPTFSPRPTETPPSPTVEATLTPVPSPTEIAPSPTEVIITPTEPAPTLEPEQNKALSKVISRGNQNKTEVAFTFDDAGDGLHKILDICNQKGIKATFFLLAGELKSCPKIWRQAVEDGHQICSHGVCHRMDLGKLSKEQITNDILGWEKVCKDVLGEEYLNKMKRDFPYFRAPGGNKTDRLQKILGNLGYPITAYWSREDCYFKTHNPKKLTLVENYVVNLKKGDIFLAHGGTSASVAEIIDGVEKEGYTFKLLSEILD